MTTSPSEAAVHSSDCPAALTRGVMTPAAVAAGFGRDRGGMIPVPAALSQETEQTLATHLQTHKTDTRKSLRKAETAADVTIQRTGSRHS